MKAMKHLKLAAAGMLGLFLTASASAQAPIGQPLFEGHSASFVRQDTPSIPVMDPVAAPEYQPVQQDCFGSMQSFGSGMEFAIQADILDGDAAHITVTVPEKAKIFVNGDPTASEGTTRNFVVHRLEAGQQYKFVFRAEMENAAGVKMEEKKELMLKLGDNESFSLTPWQRVPDEEKPAEGEPAK